MRFYLKSSDFQSFSFGEIWYYIRYCFIFYLKIKESLQRTVTFYLQVCIVIAFSAKPFFKTVIITFQAIKERIIQINLFKFN